jgi:glycosyltransferase involved in cell wall biosynthesis
LPETNLLISEINVRIINAMFGCKKGGIEQAFLDYGSALSMQGNDVVALVHPHAQILPALIHSDMTIETVTNYGNWDVAAVWKIKQILQRIKPDGIIAHGNRAVILLRKATTTIPIIGVCHNYNLKHLVTCDALLSITEDLRNVAISKNFPAENIFKVPNMIPVRAGMKPRASLSLREPVTIGTMGRFVKKKGFDVFIQALALLKEKSIPFRAIIGGSGAEDQNLRKLVSSFDLDNEVVFRGWVEDKSLFFKECDIFCLPSLHEPFGIVLLEAFLHSLPVVTTDSEGPVEIAEPGKDALVVAKGNPAAMATAIERLITDQKLAASLAVKGFATVTNRYSSEVIGMLLHDTVSRIITKKMVVSELSDTKSAK